MTVKSTDNEIIKRKPRIVGFQKVFKKFFRSSLQYIFPTIRYGKYYINLYHTYYYYHYYYHYYYRLNAFANNSITKLFRTISNII